MKLTKNARLGLKLFAVYLVLYGGFVLINTFAPQAMERTPIAGINLAILYGFALIIGALLLALLYGVLCDAEDEMLSTDDAASPSAGKDA